ncbi:MAG: hypothetical protein ABI674_04950 [Spartobacteria bacterium]
MKKTFLSILLAAASSVAFGQGQGELTTTTSTTTTGRVETELAKPRPPYAAPIVPKEGAVQVALRTGQPIQLINPTAPAEYGNGHDRVSHDPKDPGKPKGIVLFAWTW